MRNYAVVYDFGEDLSVWATSIDEALRLGRKDGRDPALLIDVELDKGVWLRPTLADTTYEAEGIRTPSVPPVVQDMYSMYKFRLCWATGFTVALAATDLADAIRHALVQKPAPDWIESRTPEGISGGVVWKRPESPEPVQEEPEPDRALVLQADMRERAAQVADLRYSVWSSHVGKPSETAVDEQVASVAQNIAGAIRSLPLSAEPPEPPPSITIARLEEIVDWLGQGRHGVGNQALSDLLDQARLVVRGEV